MKEGLIPSDTSTPPPSGGTQGSSSVAAAHSDSSNPASLSPTSPKLSDGSSNPQ